MSYGIELVIDLHDCDPATFTRKSIEQYLQELCETIDMERADLHWWDYDDAEEKEEAPPHLKGTSAVQFIMTSTIVIHTLDDLQRVYLNIFSCKDFNTDEAAQFSASWFNGKIKNSTPIRRD